MKGSTLMSVAVLAGLTFLADHTSAAELGIKEQPSLKAIFDKSRTDFTSEPGMPLRPLNQVHVITRKLSAPHFFAPWAAGLTNSSENLVFGDPVEGFFCGATLITPKWAVTAAHCVEDVDNPSSITVLYGADKISSGKSIRAQKVFLHPEFDNSNLRNNIALIGLETPISDANLEFPKIGFEPFELSMNFSDARVVGWGSISEGGPLSNHLVQIDATIVERDLCNSPTSYAGKVSQDMLCAAPKLVGVDACQGFSGSGLVSRGSGNSKLVGIVSWGAGCGRPNKPTVYTDVSRMAHWIWSTIEKYK